MTWLTVEWLAVTAAVLLGTVLVTQKTSCRTLKHHHSSTRDKLARAHDATPGRRKWPKGLDSTDIRQSVFRFLDVDDLGRCSQVGMEWNDTIRKATKLWNQCCIHNWGIPGDRKECIVRWKEKILARKLREMERVKIVRAKLFEKGLYWVSRGALVSLVPALYSIHRHYSLSPLLFQLVLGGITGGYIAHNRWIERIWIHSRYRVIICAILITLAMCLSYSLFIALETAESAESHEVQEIDQFEALLVLYLIHFLRVNAFMFFFLGIYINLTYRNVPDPWWFLFANGLWILILGEIALLANSVRSLPHEALFWQVLFLLSSFMAFRCVIILLVQKPSWNQTFTRYPPVEHYQREFSLSIVTIVLSKFVLWYFDLYDSLWILAYAIQFALRHLLLHLVALVGVLALREMSHHADSLPETRGSIDRLCWMTPLIFESLLIFFKCPDMWDMRQVLIFFWTWHPKFYRYLRIFMVYAWSHCSVGILSNLNLFCIFLNEYWALEHLTPSLIASYALDVALCCAMVACFRRYSILVPSLFCFFDVTSLSAEYQLLQPFYPGSELILWISATVAVLKLSQSQNHSCKMNGFLNATILIRVLAIVIEVLPQTPDPTKLVCMDDFDFCHLPSYQTLYSDDYAVIRFDQIY